MPNPSNHYRHFGLDLLRALAILVVLISHLAKPLDPLGFWGVELFFALSGYLIGGILWRNYSSSPSWTFHQIVNFWSRRWWRTIPNYLLFLVVAIFYFKFRTGDYLPVSRLYNFFWFGQDFLAWEGGFYVVSWSLCIEEWFYFSFPLVLFILNLMRLSRQATFTLAILVIFLFCAWAREWAAQAGYGENLRHITICRLDAVATGVLVAFGSQVLPLRVFRPQISLLLAGLLLLIISSLLPFSIQLVTVPLGFSLLLPFFSSLPRPAVRWAIVSGLIERISLWSYSIYLAHMPILFTIYLLLVNFRTTSLRNIAVKVFAMSLTLIVSAVLFRYFETPLTRLRPRELNSSAKPQPTIQVQA